MVAGRLQTFSESPHLKICRSLLAHHMFQLRFCNTGITWRKDANPFLIDPNTLHQRDKSHLCGQRRNTTPLLAAMAVFPHEVCPRIATEIEKYGIFSFCTLPLHLLANPFIYPFCLFYSMPFVCMPQLCCFTEGGITEGGKMILPSQACTKNLEFIFLPTILFPFVCSYHCFCRPYLGDEEFVDFVNSPRRNELVTLAAGSALTYLVFVGWNNDADSSASPSTTLKRSS